jgi:serine/threonine-protein kinase
LDERRQPPVVVGDIIAGKYRVERVLGIGGMGVVVAAIHEELGERRAIKFMLPEAASRERGVQRFLREARAAARLRSDRVVRVHDVGRLPGGEPYMVMEYLDGFDLKKMVRLSGLPPVDRAVDLVMQALEAVAAAHAAGIVHRDLKPANLFVTEGADGEAAIKVLDFGISKIADGEASDGDMTKTNATLGSPFYMSPEQMKSTKEVDGRTDLWSLGVILYELLTGKRPFTADSIPGYLLAAATEEPAPPSARAAGTMPAGLDAVVLRCLEKNRAERYPDAVALGKDLAPFGSSESHRSLERIEWLGSGQKSGSGPGMSFRRSHPSMPLGTASEQVTLAAEVAVLGTADVEEATGTTLGMQRNAERPARRPGVDPPLLLGAVVCMAVGALGLWFVVHDTTEPASGSARVASPPRPAAASVPSAATTSAPATAAVAATRSASAGPQAGPAALAATPVRAAPPAGPASASATAAPAITSRPAASTDKPPATKPAATDDPFGMERL